MILSEYRRSETRMYLKDGLNSNLVDSLVATLNDEEINYCHWKSNIDLAQATAGEMDLDFLVERRSHQQVISILSRLGFKAAVARWGSNSPGISHFYGYDSFTDRFAHVHLFSRVLTGESFSKSHLLPFEAMMLQNVRYVDQMRVTTKPAELVLFTIRTYIKYGSLLDILYMRKKAGKVRSELSWLKKDGGNLSTSLELLKKYCPVVDEKLFLECLDTLEGNASLLRRIGLARQVRRRIRNYAKYTFWQRNYSYLELFSTQLRRKIGSGNKKNKILKAGGFVIAIVGPDATGKSTLVSETSRWLGREFLVNVLHAGKPPASWSTAPVDVATRLSRRYFPNLRSSIKKKNGISYDREIAHRKESGLAGLLYALRAVILAWDRRNLLLKGWRAAARGEIVICDRYPSDLIGAMDSPRLTEKTGGLGWFSKVKNRLAQLEHRLYAQIPPPDLVLRLQVSMETAVERNRKREKAGGEPDGFIESRHRHAPLWERTDAGNVFDIDTEQPLVDTLRQVKELVWRSI